MAAKKYLSVVSGVLTEIQATVSSAGAGDDGKIVALDSAGKLDNSVMPTGIGADTASIEASENLTAGDVVNIYDSSGAKCRKAGADNSRPAHGFVLAGVTSGAQATVYFEGANTQVSGLTPGPQFLSATAGAVTATAPSGSGNIVQRVGIATSATSLNFESGDPITLA